MPDNAIIPARPVLFDYFRNTALLMWSKYERSKGQTASANLGFNRELFCTDFLEKVLPRRLHTRRGEVWDSAGNRTGQLDLIVVRDDGPTIEFGGADAVLAEGVFAVVEVKSVLTREKLREAISTLQRLKKLTLNVKPSMSHGPTLDRPLRCIFAYESASPEVLIEELERPENSGIVDVISVISGGAFLHKGILYSWEGPKRWLAWGGGAAALAMLYYVLTAYSTSGLMRYIDVSRYFEPMPNWSDTVP